MKHFLYVVTLLLCCLFCSCSETVEQIPIVLIEADSAYMRGHYDLGSNLLDAYIPENESEAVCRYRQLLGLERLFMRGNLDTQHYVLADSLCQYYQINDTRDKYVKALLFLGNTYNALTDYATASITYSQAETEARALGDKKLLCFVCRIKGDLYFKQRMLDDCLPYYREYYYLTVATGDTLRAAMGAASMGRYYTVKGDADSTIYYYKQAIKLGESVRQDNDVAASARKQLADIYIQIDEYDSALTHMTRDADNDQNWAYWHLGQGHLDSASYYFQKKLKTASWQAGVDYLHELVELECRRGNMEHALTYCKKIIAAKDSLKVQSQSENVRRLEARYNYDSMKREKERIESENRIMKRNTQVVILAFMLLFVVLFFALLSVRRKRNAELEHGRLLLQEERVRSRQSQEQLLKDKEQIAQLEQQLQEAQQRGDTTAMRLAQYEKDMIAAEQQSIEARHRRQQFLREEFMRSRIYIRIKENIGAPDFTMTTEDWLDLAKGLNKTYDQFTSRLLALTDMRDTELRICQLMKIDVKPIDIARIIGRSRSAVTLTCKKLAKRLTGHDGTATDLADFLKDF